MTIVSTPCVNTHTHTTHPRHTITLKEEARRVLRSASHTLSLSLSLFLSLSVEQTLSSGTVPATKPRAPCAFLHECCSVDVWCGGVRWRATSTRCNKLQHASTRCNTRQHTALQVCWRATSRHAAFMSIYKSNVEKQFACQHHLCVQACRCALMHVRYVFKDTEPCKIYQKEWI